MDGDIEERVIEDPTLGVAAVLALADLYEKYVVDVHGEKTCDCDKSVGMFTCAPCEARAVLERAGIRAEPGAENVP